MIIFFLFFLTVRNILIADRSCQHLFTLFAVRFNRKHPQNNYYYLQNVFTQRVSGNHFACLFSKAACPTSKVYYFRHRDALWRRVQPFPPRPRGISLALKAAFTSVFNFLKSTTLRSKNGKPRKFRMYSIETWDLLCKYPPIWVENFYGLFSIRM